MFDGDTSIPGQISTTPDSPTDYSLFSNPPALRAMRQRLFDVDEQIEMSLADFEAYFPFVDNFWRKRAPGKDGQSSNVATDIYWCRLRRPPGVKQPREAKPTPEGKMSRKKRGKQETICGMAFQVVHNEDSKTCTIKRAVSPGLTHTHNMEYMDTLKRCTGIMDTARREAVKGFLPTSVHAKLWSEPEKMEEAGGKHMKLSDVRNVQYRWRRKNADVPLKAHTGFSGQKSTPSSRRRKSADVSYPTPAQVQGSQPAPYHQPAPNPVPPPPQMPPDFIEYPLEARHFLEKYLPDPGFSSPKTTPHVTLTYASSLDSRLSIVPGVRTAISGPETKAMTHYLRSRHDAILIGVRTAIADDPSLNCRLLGSGGYGGPEAHQQPRPIIIDPHARLHIRPEMNLLQAVNAHRARGPWIVVAPGAVLHPTAVAILKAYGGEYLMINDFQPQQGLGLNWDGLFQILYKEGIRSLMVEGGGTVISELLRPHYARLVDSVVITIAPNFLGRSGTSVSPDTSFDQHGQPVATRLTDVTWQPMGVGDVVFCGKFVKFEPVASPSRGGQTRHQPHQQHPHTNGILRGIEDFTKPQQQQQDQEDEEKRVNARLVDVAKLASSAR